MVSYAWLNKVVFEFSKTNNENLFKFLNTLSKKLIGSKSITPHRGYCSFPFLQFQTMIAKANRLACADPHAQNKPELLEPLAVNLDNECYVVDIECFAVAMRWMFHAMKTDAVKYGAVIYMPWMFHAMKTDAVKYAAFIYMLWFTMP